MDLQTQTTLWSIALGIVTGALGFVAKYVLGRRAQQHQHQQARQLEQDTAVREALVAVAKARFRLVTAMLELAHCEVHDRTTHLDQCRSRYEDLRLAVQTQCQLQETECLVTAARRFKYAALDRARDGQLKGHQLAKRTMEVASDFNGAFDELATAVGLAPAHYPKRG